MPDPQKLDRYGDPVRVGDYVLRTPGVSGTVAQLPLPPRAATRTRGTAATVLDDALAAVDMNPEEALVFDRMDVESLAETARRRSRSASASEPVVVIDAPATTLGYEQVALVEDAHGALSWHVGTAPDEDTPNTRGAGTQRFVIPLPTVVETSDDRTTRSVIGRLALAAVRFISFKLVKPVGGAVGHYFVKQFEANNRQYSLRRVTSDNHRRPVIVPPDEADWDHLGADRALLLVHGTASRTDIAFSGLRPEFIDHLNEHYGDRVFGFDHPTLSADPRDNVRVLAETLPRDARLHLDVVSHSRGGLVTRLLAEQAGAFGLSDRVKIRRAIFVATPNNGTPLSDADHVGSFVDAFTNLLTHVPDAFEPAAKAADALASVLAVVKDIAAGTAERLSGLQSMLPTGDFLEGLNVDGPPDSAQYYALSSNYEPANKALKSFVADRLADLLFLDTENDVIVPTSGVYESNGSHRFPIDLQHTFPPEAGVAHTTFFKHPDVERRLRDWLA